MSCYYFNVYNNNHKIILWLENNIPNQYNNEIAKYAEIRQFCLAEQKDQIEVLSGSVYYRTELSFYSDLVKYILLYNYGGVRFDLDCFFLRSFDPLLVHYGQEICVYQRANQNYPDGAIYVCLEAGSEKLENVIKSIRERGNGSGFQEANLTYDLSLDLLVLPCSWFNAEWTSNSYHLTVDDFFQP